MFNIISISQEKGYLTEVYHFHFFAPPTVLPVRRTKFGAVRKKKEKNKPWVDAFVPHTHSGFLEFPVGVGWLKTSTHVNHRCFP